MASVRKRVRDGNTTYLARWREPDGRQRKKSFTRKTDADAFATTIKAQMLHGAYVDVTDKTTVAEYARQWAAARPHRPSTARRVTSLIDTHIAGHKLGGRRLSAVRPSEIQAWASDRATVLAPSTLRNLVSLLRGIYASAVLDRLVASSPVIRVTLPRHERPRVVPLSVAEVRKLAETMPARNRAMVITQAGLGLRIGELLALRVRDVDFLGRTARVETQIAPGAKTRSDPKTPRSKRTLPLPAVVGDALAAHLAAYPAGTDGSIFTTRTGAVYRHDYYGAQIFARAVKRAELPEGTTTHALRHHYASVLLDAGESVVAVAERLGHENAALVLSTYGHLIKGTDERTRRAIDSAWSAPSAPREGASTA